MPLLESPIDSQSSAQLPDEDSVASTQGTPSSQKVHPPHVPICVGVAAATGGGGVMLIELVTSNVPLSAEKVEGVVVCEDNTVESPREVEVLLVDPVDDPPPSLQIQSYLYPSDDPQSWVEA